MCSVLNVFCASSMGIAWPNSSRQLPVRSPGAELQRGFTLMPPEECDSKLDGANLNRGAPIAHSRNLISTLFCL